MSKHHSEVTISSDTSLRGMCAVAYDNATRFIDEYSEYGVGVVLKVRYEHGSEEYEETYSSHNIRLSGVQIAMHAEQLAVFNALLDISKLSDPSNASLDSIVIVTTGDDIATKCGHCMQILQSVCKYTNTDGGKFTINGADRLDGDGDDNPIWNIKRATIDSVIGETYVENRDRS